MIKLNWVSNILFNFKVNSFILASKSKSNAKKALFLLLYNCTLLWLVNHLFPISHFQELKGLLTIIN
jgi:hypothetical protein